MRNERTIIPNRIGELRRAKGLSLAALAKQVGTTAATIDRLEKSKIKLSLNWMDRLSEALEVRPGDLVPGFGDTGTPEASGDDRWPEKTLRINVNTLRAAIVDAFLFLGEAHKREPAARLTPDVLAFYVWHRLEGLPLNLNEVGIRFATAWLLRGCGEEEKAQEAERQARAALKVAEDEIRAAVQEVTDKNKEIEGLKRLTTEGPETLTAWREASD
jgi:transcriptional regulator with XRE-family HTH domain